METLLTLNSARTIPGTALMYHHVVWPGEMVPYCIGASLHLEYEPDQVDISMTHPGGSECFARVYIATNNQDAVPY